MSCRSRCTQPRTFQTLLGDIHDCDVWAHDLPLFLEEESQRTLVYFGHLEPFAPLVPGIMALQENRQHYRMQRYEEFVTFWHQVQEQGIWAQLRQTLDATVENAERAIAAAAEGTLMPGQADIAREDLACRACQTDRVRDLWWQPASEIHRNCTGQVSHKCRHHWDMIRRLGQLT